MFNLFNLVKKSGNRISREEFSHDLKLIHHERRDYIIDHIFGKKHVAIKAHGSDGGSESMDIDWEKSSGSSNENKEAKHSHSHEGGQLEHEDKHSHGELEKSEEEI